MIQPGHRDAALAQPATADPPSLVVLADVHGNLPALEAIVASLSDKPPSGYVVAGDLTGGPQSNETTRLLRSLGSQMIRGNSDTRLLQFARNQCPSAWRTSEAYALLRWNVENAAPDVIALLASLPEDVVIRHPDTEPIRVVHGSPRSPSEGLDPVCEPAVLNDALSRLAESMLICAHSHQQWCYQRNGKLALNPGSVGGPLDGHIGAQYARLTWDGNRWLPEMHLVHYDLDLTRRAFRCSGLLEKGGALARAFLLSIETGTNVPLYLLEHVSAFAEESGSAHEGVVTDAVWELATAAFDWDRFEELAAVISHENQYPLQT